MRLTVFGATGGIGREMVGQALAAGHRVTAVVRSASAWEIEHPELTVVRVSGLSDAALPAEALAGSDAALSGVGPRSSKDLTVASTATRAILGAMEMAGVKRFVAVSAAPVAPVPPGDSLLNRWLLFPVITRVLRGIYADLTVMEQDIEASGIEWTVVRPPRLDNKPLGRYRTVVGANVPRGTSISRADVAHAMLAALANPAVVRQAIGVAR